MTEKENKYSIGLPFSVILCIVCAAGGSSIFASLYSGLALLLVGLDDYEVLFVKDYIFVFVFCTVYSATFVAQMKKWKGTKWWQIVHVLFLLFYLTCYIFRFWPQAPQFVPGFTVRAFLWYGGSLALSIVASHYAEEYFDFVSRKKSSGWIYFNMILTLTLGVMIVVVPLALVTFSNTTFDLPVVFSCSPALLLFFSSAIYVIRENAQLSFVELIARLLVIWYPLGLCFLLMPVILLAEKVLSKIFLEVFVVEPVHLQAAILSFVVMTISVLFGGFVGSLVKRYLSA